MSEAQNRPEVVEANRESGKRQWEEADDATRDKWCTGIKDAMNRPEVVKATSERVIAQRKRERVDEPEREAKRAAKQSANWDAKFEAKLQGKSDEERRRMELLRARMKRGRTKMNADLERLRTVWPDAKKGDLPKARRDGLIPAPASSVVSSL